jgi:hypothetical protein
MTVFNNIDSTGNISLGDAIMIEGDVMLQNISIELLLQDDGNITQFVLLHVDTWLTQNVSIVDHGKFT